MPQTPTPAARDGFTATRGSRPQPVTAALLLIAPIVAFWFAAAVYVFSRNADDNVVMAILMSGALLAVAVTGAHALYAAWRGQRRSPMLAGSVVLIYAIVIINVLGYIGSHRRDRDMELTATMLVPLTLAIGGFIALRLLKTPAAQAWLPAGNPPAA